MRRVSADPWRDSEDFKNALKQHLDAFEAQLRNVAVHQRPKIREDWYKRFRDRLLELFHNKCAYCEISLVGMIKGDVEHFRPKNGVVDADGNWVVDAQGQQHPGYWWLAYDWGNLLPACRDCNGTRHKGNKFPIEGVRAQNRPETDKQVLINPLEDEPAEHITWDVATGSPVWLDDRGEQTIKILGLDEERLNELRLREKFDARTRARVIITQSAPLDDLNDARNYLSDAKSGVREFSAYILAVMKKERDDMVANADEI